MKLVLDTSVLVAAARSKSGASRTGQFHSLAGIPNVKDFHGAEQLGGTVISPREFLKIIRQKS